MLAEDASADDIFSDALSVLESSYHEDDEFVRYGPLVISVAPKVGARFWHRSLYEDYVDECDCMRTEADWDAF
jgi:hypothetical protein